MAPFLFLDTLTFVLSMGERLGRYELQRHLATGGMGEIFLAEHTGISGFRKRVALKRIRADLAAKKSYVDLFLNEARLGSFLNHPNIVHMFDVGHDGGSLWLAMEYVDGVDMKRLSRRARLTKRPLSPATVAAIAIEVLSALDEAHAGGPLEGEPIIHRDLSPENVLVARSGAIKVLDFGLAKWVPGRAAVPSLEGNQIFGKIRYMPPEQLKGELIDVRADLFALGAVMYEALCGVVPFGGDNANDVLRANLDGPPRPATTTHPTPDPQMDAVIQRALHPDRARRFQSAAQMRAALVDYLRHRGVALPLEELREVLHPDVARAKEDSSDGVWAANSGSKDTSIPIEIALGPPNPCGKCGGRFGSWFCDGMILDRCQVCEGVWVDQAEIERLSGTLSQAAPPSRPSIEHETSLDRISGSCPTCHAGLHAYTVPDEPVAIEVCAVCLGVWFDRGETTLLAKPGVHPWLREKIAALRVGVTS